MNLQILEEIKKKKIEGSNFQTIKKEIGEDRLKEFLNTIYPKFSIAEIEKITGIADSTLGYWFLKLNIPLVRNHIRTRALAGDKNKTEAVITIEDKTYELQTIEITPELSYIIGFALGDGSISQYMVEVFNKDRKLKGHLFEFLKPYGTISEEERDYGLWRLRLSNGRIANLIKDQEGIRLDTLEYIFKNDDLAEKFIAGFWDAEGTVRLQNKYYHLYLYNSKLPLLEMIRRYLIEKGIKISTLIKDQRGESHYVNGRLLTNKKIMYRLSVPKESAKKWIKHIGINMLHSKKGDMIQQMIKNKYGEGLNE